MKCKSCSRGKLAICVVGTCSKCDKMINYSHHKYCDSCSDELNKCSCCGQDNQWDKDCICDQFDERVWEKQLPNLSSYCVKYFNELEMCNVCQRNIIKEKKGNCHFCNTYSTQ